MNLDLSNPVSMLRLRLGDTKDYPQMLPDEVYEKTITDCNGNLKKAATLCGQYILVQLAFKTHQRMGTLELWGREAYISYRDYLTSVVSNPDFAGISPIPYSQCGTSPIIQFQKDWDKQYDCDPSNNYTGCPLGTVHPCGEIP